MHKFKRDVIDLLNRKRGGHVEGWLYNDQPRGKRSGSQLWHKFLRSAHNYYVLKNEIKIINGLASHIANDIHGIDTVVDFGVGEKAALEHKTLPIIKGLPSVQHYVGIDLSGDFLRAAGTSMQNHLPGISYQSIKGDFFRGQFVLPGQKRLGLMLGSTITNQELREGRDFPFERITRQLQHLKHQIGAGHHFILSYDANPDARSAMLAYQNKYWSRHVTGIMYDVQRIAKGDVQPASWAHRMVWNEKAHVIHQCAEATQDLQFTIDQHEFDIKAGERFVTVNNFKYPRDLFKSMCQEAGFEVRKEWTDEQNRMVLQHLIATL